jgi:chromosome segregation ATPase
MNQEHEAETKGGRRMSLVGTLKEREAQLHELQERLTQVTATLDAAQAETAKSKKELAEQAEACKVGYAEMIAKHDKAIGEAKATQDAAVARADAVEKELADVKAKLEASEKKLTFQAYTDAAPEGTAKESAQKMAASAVAKEADASQTPCWDEYKRLSDPSAKTRFWQANEQKLLAEMRAVNG